MSLQTTYLPPLVRGKYQSRCVVGIVNIPSDGLVLRAAAVRSPPASVPRHSAAHRTETLPGCPN